MKQLFAMAMFAAILIPLFACSGTDRRAGPNHNMDHPRETFDCPVEAYYAGWIEEAIRLLSGPGASSEQKFQLAMLHWELGENAKAANLLEERLRDPNLTMAERDELYLELFITRVLMGSYTQAAALRDSMEPALQRMDNRERAQFYFYNAWVYHEMGEGANAEVFYRRSLDIYRWRAVAWYRLGTILFDSNPAEAEAAFQAAWNQDTAFTRALLPLARLLAARGEWERARGLLVTANARLPDDLEVSTALTEALRHAMPPVDAIYLIQRSITAVPPRVTPAPIIPGEGTMRIGLSENRRLVSVRSGGGFTIRNAMTGQILYSTGAREQFWVEWRGNGALVIFNADNRLLLNSSDPVVYELNSNHDTSIVAGAVPGANRTFRGALEFRPGPGGITVVNIVHMGDYLYGVVPAELPASWPMESLKAQAIIARSYAIAYRGRFAYRGFDIWGDARSQAYGGVGAEHPRSTAAVNATMGMILVGESDEPLAAYYSANHGGHSEDSLVMWGREAYMQAVQDRMLPPRPSPLPPGDLFRWLRDSPPTYSNIPGFFFANTYRWERWISPEEIRRRLIVDRRIAQDPGEIRRIVTRGRGISGRIVELEVQGSEGTVRVRGDAVWFTMGGLRSSLFAIRSKQDADGRVRHFVFQGAGYGHGMGMDQHAAAGKASRGMNAEEILLHFYPRARLRQLE